MKCPNCENDHFNEMGYEEPFAQCKSCGWMVCTPCAGTGAVDTPFSGSDPCCEACAGEGAFDPNVGAVA